MILTCYISSSSSSSSVPFLLVALQLDDQSDELLVPKSAKVVDEQYLQFTITSSVHGFVSHKIPAHKKFFVAWTFSRYIQTNRL
jgi:hypothetical protein